MLVENWDKIYGINFYTNNTMYEVRKDSMAIAPNAHTLKLIPVSGSGSLAFTIVVTKMQHGVIKCGIYVDSNWNPLEIFEMNRLNLKSIDAFKSLLSAKIPNHE
jgi:hypothetical protein